MARDPANPGTAADGGSSGEDEVAAKLAAEQDAGGRGEFVDPTPNENYTFAGAAAGLPTPETDEAAAADARQATRLGQTKFEHAGAAETSEASEPKSAPKLAGDELQAKLDELEIDSSIGGSNADGSMNADEKRAAIAAAEADAGNGGS